MILTCILTLLVVAVAWDANVGDALLLLPPFLKALSLRLKWKVANDPDLPWVRWAISRRSDSSARKLARELGLDEGDREDDRKYTHANRISTPEENP